MSRLRTPLVIFALLPLAVATTTAAAAADFATRDQLRSCLDTEDKLKTQREALDASAKSREQMRTDIAAERTSLAQMHKNLNRSSKASVDAYNDAARKLNAHVRDLNKSSADAKPAADAYKTGMASYNQRCASQSYSSEDMDAVAKERAKAASSS